MLSSLNSLIEGEPVLPESVPLKKGHRISRWKRRFFVLAAITIVSNLALLYALAYAYYTPSRAFTLTKEDMRTLLTLLPGQVTRNELRESVKKLDALVDVKESEQQISVGGFVFYFDEAGDLERVEHWAADQQYRR